MIDWDATGSMLSGTAAYLGVGAVIYAAKQGRDAVADWRAQKQEERRLDTAEKILTAAYRARSALESIRANFMTGGELKAAESTLSEAGLRLEEVEERRAQRLRTAQGILNRAQRFRADYDNLFEVLPLAEAYFETEIPASLREFVSQWNTVIIAAESYADDDGSDPEFSRTLRTEIWKGHSSGKNDPVQTKVNGAIKTLESALLPVIRSNHGSRK